jgi:CRISPR-associated endonuclease/helicase Cas3
VQGEWHSLFSHLEATAQRSSEFARPFDGETEAFFIGLFHDLGKANPDFQSYLKAQEEKERYPIVPHALVGAALIRCRLRKNYEELVIPIAGHHAGLYEPGDLDSRLKAEWDKCSPDLRVFLQQVAQKLAETHNPKIPSPRDESIFRREFRIRMLSSCLVDADYLDTENHFDPQKAKLRKIQVSLPDLWERFAKDQKTLMEKVEPTTVNDVRKEVYEACLRAAEGPQGIYKLTVPTGGGKTRSGLAFALKHALKHGLRRIIVAIPYTNIIGQTVQVYREVLGKGAVIEHHSQVSFPDDESQNLFKLASENWDVPLVVTTTVQLFESLFSNKPSKCRKLHNIAKSVIILDEVQTLPPELLEPTADVLRTLVEEYGVTLVLSTATQPALENSSYLKAFKGVSPKEIVPQYEKYFQRLRRVEYERRKDPITFQTLAEKVAQEDQVLVVMNSRKDAMQLIAYLKDTPHLFHLSTLLCGAHRKEVLEEVNERLETRKPVRLISTQVVEAGVDLDFPAVYRTVGPLDRIVQAAGRCNRNGVKTGKVVISNLRVEKHQADLTRQE